MELRAGKLTLAMPGRKMVADLTKRAEDAGEEPLASMDVSDAARAVIQMAELPPEANVPFMTIMATGMPYIGRG